MMMTEASGDGSTFDPSSSSKLEKNPVVLMKIPMYRAKIILTHWKIIPRNPNYEGWSLSAQIRDCRRKWCVTSIKTKDKQNELYIGMH